MEISKIYGIPIGSMTKAAMKVAVASLVMALSLTSGNLAQAEGLDAYNVVWDTPSQNHHGSMPLGNGDIGLNAWMEPNGDLCFYIGKTDSWGENARLLKIGKVRVQLDPNPFKENPTFRQTLNLKNGEILVESEEGGQKSKLRVWVDANHPVIQVETSCETPVKATASIELWRTKRDQLPSVEVSDIYSTHPDQSKVQFVEPDTVITGLTDSIGWYHHNSYSLGPDLTMEFQGLEECPSFKDTILHRTFGALVKAGGDGAAAPSAASNGESLAFPAAKAQRLSIYVLTEQPSTPEQWKKSMSVLIKRVEAKSFESRRQAHLKWWRSFWNRSHLFVTPNPKSEENKVRLITPSKHSVKIGVDLSGGSKFDGSIGRVSIYENSLSEAKVKQLADTGHEKKAGLKVEPAYSGTPSIDETIADSAAWNGKDGLTLEAWVKPGKLPGSGARIIDKSTPGGFDGFLLDTYPGNSLRLITAGGTLIKNDCLPADKWSHVAATVNPWTGALQLFLNGKVILDQKPKTDNNKAFVVARAYNLQRFIDACGSRGQYPIKFNGSIFTVPHEAKPGDADYRRKGGGFWWQNTRLPYLSMCAAGDFDMMDSLFRMYAEDILPVSQYRTKKYFGHDGAYFPASMYQWGAVITESYGWDKAQKDRKDPLQRSRSHKWGWAAGPELVFMMQDYYDYTGDKKFLKNRLLPTANAVIQFFDNFYETENGKLVMHPAMALETWWDCTNPMPELAGLHAITQRLSALPKALTTEKEREFWKEFSDKLPPLPLRDTKSGKALAPAELFKSHKYLENPELYAVFPFRLVALESENREHGLNALTHRWHGGHFGWRQDDLFMAYLGLADQAKKAVIERANDYDKSQRFPAFWGPNYDWTPDQTHGGVLTRTVQAMLMQADPYSDKIHLLPAWPEAWDADFKLHAPKGTVIECTVKDGQVTDLKVTPEFRRKDIIISK